MVSVKWRTAAVSDAPGAAADRANNYSAAKERRAWLANVCLRLQVADGAGVEFFPAASDSDHCLALACQSDVGLCGARLDFVHDEGNVLLFAHEPHRRQAT
ncbi:MAG: hypothetical protein ACKPKO_34815, partial [Candidatus Fonsibacter sp.]